MLRKLPAVIICLLLSLCAYSQQPPNGTFEAWTDSLPDSWETINSGDSLVPITPTADAHSGSLAIHGEVFDFNGGHVPPSFHSAGGGGLGSSIVTRYVGLSGWYKADLIGSNYIVIQVTIFAQNGISIGIGSAHYFTQPNYTRFYLPIGYTNNTPARYVKIEVFMADTSGLGFNLGSNYTMDDFNLEIVSEVPTVPSLDFNVGPNPAADLININGEFKSGIRHEVTLYNSLGKTVLQKIVEPSGNSLPPIDVSTLPEGNYLLFVSDYRNTNSQKIIIIR